MKRRKRSSKPKQHRKSPRRNTGRKKLPAADRLQIALGSMRSGKSLAASAKKAGYSRKRLRSVLIETKLGQKAGHRWVLAKRGGRRMLMFSNGEAFHVAVSHKTSTEIGHYLAAVKQFFEDQDDIHLHPYTDVFITDLLGKKYEFEVRPNHLYRLDQAGGEPYEQAYQYIV